MLIFKAQRSDYFSQCDIAILEDSDGTIKALQPLAFKYIEHIEGSMLESSLRLKEQEGQRLFDALWQAGYRPKVLGDQDKQVEAVKYHLEDMRRLVFESSKEGGK